MKDERHRKIKEEDIIKLHEEEKSDKEIATILGVSQGGINYRREKLGFENNCHKIPPKFNEDLFYVLYEKGWTDKQIAGRLDLTAPAINYQRVKRGLRSNEENKKVGV